MTSNGKTSLALVEYIFYVVLILSVSSGVVDSYFSYELSLIFFVKIVLSAVWIGFFLISYKYNSLPSQIRSMFIMTLATILAVHLTRDAGTGTSQLTIFYYLLVSLFAITSKPTIWLNLLILVALSELLPYMKDFVYVVKNPIEYKLLITKLSSISESIFYWSVLASALGYISAIRNKNHGTKFIADDTKDPSMMATTAFKPNEEPQPINIPKTSVYKMNETLEINPRDEEDLDSIVFFLTKYFQTFSSLAFIYNPSKGGFFLKSLQSKSLAVRKGMFIPAGTGFVGGLTSNQKMFSTGDLSSYGRAPEYYTTGELVNSLVVAPIKSKDGELLGALSIDSKEKRAFSDVHYQALEKFATFAAALINNIRMRKVTDRSAKQFQMFYNATMLFSAAKTSEDVREAVVKSVSLIANFTRIIFLGLDTCESTCEIKGIYGNSAEIPKNLSFHLNDGYYSYVCTSKKDWMSNDITQLPPTYYRFASNEPPNLISRSMVIFPTGSRGYGEGAVSFEHASPGFFTENLISILKTIVGNASVAYEKAYMFEEKEREASIDGLTQLYNHKTFQERLHEEILRSARGKHNLSLLLFDIDHFKNFNDTYGHAVGDIVLKNIAQTLKATVRQNDLAVRYGGEEFCVIAPETSIEEAVRLAERVRANIEKMDIETPNGQHLSVTISIGCSSLPLHASTQQELINYADTAMYYSKESGRNRVSIYNKNMKMQSN